MGFVALWMFALGVLVGRGTAPVHFDLDRLQKQLAELKQRVTTEEGERFKVNLEKLNFFKSLKEMETKPSGPVPRIEAKFKKPPERVPVQQPAPDIYLPREGEAAAESASQGTAGRLFIQIASSKDADATRRLVTRLQEGRISGFQRQDRGPLQGHLVPDPGRPLHRAGRLPTMPSPG